VDNESPAFQYTLEPIQDHHDVSNFACGNSFLDAYLIGSALPDQLADKARTYVLIDAAEPPPHRS
jgi:hypothetical protein